MLALIIGGISWYKSPAHNPNSPFANTNITFKNYNVTFSQDDDDDGSTIQRVSAASTFKVIDNVLLIMYKNGDGNSASYRYFSTHKELQKLGEFYWFWGIRPVPEDASKSSTEYMKEVTISNKDEDALIKQEKKWEKLIKNDKKAQKIVEDWYKWLESCAGKEYYGERSEGFLDNPQSYVKFDAKTPSLQNGEKVLVELGGNTQILKKYNVDLRPIKVKVAMNQNLITIDLPDGEGGGSETAPEKPSFLEDE